MKYWISIKEFRQGHQVNSMDDDNEGKGYTKNAAKKKAAIMDNVSFDGPAEGTEAKVYDWAPQRPSKAHTKRKAAELT